MGTSSGYQMPSGGAWTPLKNDASDFISHAGSGSVGPERLVQSYLTAIGGPRGIEMGQSLRTGGSGGGGGTSGPSSSRSSAAAARVARKLGGFYSRVGSVGLNAALQEYGLAHLVGKSAVEIATGMLEALVGPASTIDDAAARRALSDLNKEWLREARTPEDVERALTGELDAVGLDGLLSRFFGFYVYQRFCRDFYERWVKVAGSGATTSAFRTVQNYIESALRTKLAKRDIKNVDWAGPQGGQIISQVLVDTCAVFGVPT